MKNASKFIVAAAALISISAVFAVQAVVREKPATDAPRTPREPGVVRFEPGAPQLSALRTEAVQAFDLPISEPLNGRIAYDENATARVTSPISGRVTALRGEIGDRINAGGVLARINAPDLASASADWHKAQADEVRKKLAFERAKLLLGGEVIARRDYEEAEADFRQATAETRRARQKLQNLHADGDNGSGEFALRSPIAGVIADKQVNPGMEVRPDLPNALYVVTDPSRLWAVVDVPEKNIGNVHPGQNVTLENDAFPGQRFDAKVERVGLAVDPNTRRIQVRCSVPNPDGRLRPEMFVRVSFLSNRDVKAIQVGNSGLIVEGLYNYAFVERAPGEFQKRRVEVVMRGPDRSYIGSGIEAGERVVMDGALLLNAEMASDVK